MKRPYSTAIHMAFLLSAGLVARLIPMTFSSLPYNIDGFPLVRLSEDIIASGHWTMEGGGLVAYNAKMPAFSLLLSAFSLLTGMEPMAAVQYFVPLFTLSSIVAIYAITLKITRSQTAALVAGSFLALSGFYVYLTAAAMKQTIGLALLPMILYSFHMRRDPRNRAIAALGLLLLTFVHHLSCLIAFTFVTMVVLVEPAIQLTSGRFSWKALVLDLCTGPALAAVPVYYYGFVDLETLTHLSSANDMALYLSVFLVTTIAAVVIALPPSTSPWLFASGRKGGVSLLKLMDEKVLVVVVGIAMLYLNHQLRLFGTIQTTSLFLELVIPYLVLMVAAMIGFNLFRYSKTSFSTFLPVLFLAPLTMIVYALLKGLDPLTFSLVYRTYDFLDFALAICIGIAFAFVASRAGDLFPPRAKGAEGAGRRGQLKAAVAIVAILLCAACTPLAYNWQEIYGIESVTLESEMDAMRYADENVDGLIGTDQRLADIMAPYLGAQMESRAVWSIAYARALEGDAAVLVSERWKTVGGQQAPLANVVVPEENWDSFVENNDLVYSCGRDMGTTLLVVPR